MNLAVTAMEHAARTRRQLAGVRIEYRRGSTRLELVAVPARTAYETTGDITVVEYTDADWLIEADALVIDGVKTTPTDSDQVRPLEGPGRGSVFRVMAPDGGRGWRYVDPYEKEIRVQTQRIQSERP